ncbi:TadE/TadG family type IV pilus assembly protein [Spongiactinospora sp. TRM90649]|uniref:TadE/TadG family type IV pilus assembly protein n=1 Tax=Spongiactinospora sp. TRM90649 TaxID=3031114 RepID=UPI0023FA09AD|nr:TadE/TadG family type IV pilus assembly protein [Spongiactinospora sp. TRM90649]MDF5751263.1 TadE/TadG family type IV pilus assembly protein [Spongiactinospora sp. TRM90649]
MTPAGRSRATARAERGSMSAETVLLAPVLLLFLLFLVGAGRLVEAQGEVNGAARDAARAASVQRTEDAAQTAADDAVKAALEGQCDNPAAELDIDAERPEEGSEETYGGRISAEVTCDLDLSFLGWSAGKTITGTSVVPLERFRRFE